MDYQNILIFRIGHLGDTLVSLPAFWAVRKAFPEAKITLLSNANPHRPNYVSARNILPEKGLFDDWITYPTDGGKISLLKNSFALLLRLKKNGYDAVFYMMTRNRSLTQLKRDRLFFKLAGIKKVIGTGYFEQQRLDYSVPRPLPKIETEHEFFLKSLEYENVPIADREFLKPELLLTDQEREKAARWLTANCGFERKESNKMPIAVSPSSKWPSKIWAEDRYAEVIGRLIREKNVFPIIFGGAEDREKGERLLKIWGTGANAAGELNVREAAAALAECRVLIGNDSGTMHLAASVGTPCLGIFSALDWFGRWEPFGDKNTIFRAKVECEGCLLEVCPRQNQCLDRISAESVTQAALKTLEDIK